MQKPRLERNKQSHIEYTILQALSHGEGKNIKPYYDIYASLSKEAREEIDETASIIIKNMNDRRNRDRRGTGMGELSAFYLAMRLHIMAALANGDIRRFREIAQKRLIDWQKLCRDCEAME